MTTALVAVTAETIIARQLDGQFFTMVTDPSTCITSTRVQYVPRHWVPDYGKLLRKYDDSIRAAMESRIDAKATRDKITPEIMRLHNAGLNYRQCGESVGISSSAARYIVREFKANECRTASDPDT